MDDVVDRDLADQPAGVVHHRGRDQRVLLEAQRDFLLVHQHRDQRLVALHHVDQRNAARSAQDPRELAGSDRAVQRIDDEHFPKLGSQVAVFAQIVDQAADGHVFGHRDQIALHQPSGGFVGIGQRAFDRGAVFRVELGEHRAAVFGVEILDQRDRVVGLHLLGEIGHRIGRQRFDQQFADVIVEFGEHLAAHQVEDRGGEARALVGLDQLEQIGDVGRVERLDQRVDRLPVVRVERFGNPPHERGLEDVLGVEALGMARRFGGLERARQRPRQAVQFVLAALHAARV